MYSWTGISESNVLQWRWECKNIRWFVKSNVVTQELLTYSHFYPRRRAFHLSPAELDGYFSHRGRWSCIMTTQPLVGEHECKLIARKETTWWPGVWSIPIAHQHLNQAAKRPSNLLNTKQDQHGLRPCSDISLLFSTLQKCPNKKKQICFTHVSYQGYFWSCRS